MARRVERSPDAKADLNGIAAYIGQYNPGAALRFLDAAEETFAFLAANPGIGAAHEFQATRLPDLLRWRVEGFENYLIFFRSWPDRIEIVYVIHGARDFDTEFGG